jgi:O-methyltransferase
MIKTGLDTLRSVLTWLARIVFREVDGRHYSAVIPEAMFSPWNTDESFRKVHHRILGYTTIDIYRCYELWHLVGQVAHLSGDILEVGAWRGGSGCLLAARAGQLGLPASVFLCDTFKGVVKAGRHDNRYRGGEHADSTSEIVTKLAYELELTNVVVLEGVFPEETGQRIEGHRFRLCHIDVDVYQSARHIMDWVWPRMPLGGLVVFDDFGFPNTQGIRRLVEELKPERGFCCVQNLNGHALVVKTLG